MGGVADAGALWPAAYFRAFRVRRRPPRASRGTRRASSPGAASVTSRDARSRKYHRRRGRAAPADGGPGASFGRRRRSRRRPAPQAWPASKAAGRLVAARPTVASGALPPAQRHLLTPSSRPRARVAAAMPPSLPGIGRSTRVSGRTASRDEPRLGAARAAEGGAQAGGATVKAAPEARRDDEAFRRASDDARARGE